MRKGAVAAILFVGLMTLAPARPAAASATVSLSFFHETLAPHGRWLATASYGEVWAPSVAPGWEPYVNGEWLYTDCGWSWVSDDPWGSIAFHYGTWTWVDPYGWVWVPGLVWAPAWVTWAFTDDYVGWAPVPPSFVLSVTGYVGRPIVLPQTRYVFVPARRFVAVPVATVRVPAQRNAAILPRAAKVTTFEVSRGLVRNLGPAPERIERAAGRRIERVTVERAKLRPVTLTESGVHAASRLPVVAPARERAAGLRKPPEAEKRHPVAERKPEHPVGRAAAEPGPAASRAETERRESTGRPTSVPERQAARQKAPPRQERASEGKKPRAPEAKPSQRVAERPGAPSAPGPSASHRAENDRAAAHSAPAAPPRVKKERTQAPSPMPQQAQRRRPPQPNERQTARGKETAENKRGNQGGGS